jgi:phosphatidylglycerophosphatase C
MKKIAFFDFDGTITTRDTMFELIRHQKGNRSFYLGFLANIPMFIALKLKLLSKQAAKERLLTYFFRDTELTAFQSGCDTFAMLKLPSLIRPAALDEMEKLQNEGFEIAVVSASAENWIKKWADQMEVQLLGTKLEVVGGKLTGKLLGANCNGAEKENRIRAVYDLSQSNEIYCYGDSSGDKQMLALGTKAFYKPFR